MREEKEKRRNNIYFRIFEISIPRLINLFNLDEFSDEYGNADREYWGWKLKDFASGKNWAGLFSIAIGVKSGIIRKDFAEKLLRASLLNIKKHTDKYGALQEAYPYEHSMGVTAATLYGICEAIRILGLKEKIKDEIENLYPLREFLEKYKEEHGIISNHLAAASASIIAWNRITGEKSERWKYFLDIIFENQSKKDGFYMEYEGADPGYQTLCTEYLFYVFEQTKSKELEESLKKAGRFLLHFVHPDGTIGGLYGSRNTEVFYPAGIVGLSRYMEEYACLSKYLQPHSFKFSQHILPHHIDIGNFVPLLNSYAHASEEYEKNKELILNNDMKPTWKRVLEFSFDDAGIFIKSTEKYYAILNFKKGGAIKVYDKNEKKLVISDGGAFGKLKNGKKVSNQIWSDKNIVIKKNESEKTNVEIISDIYEMNENYFSPLKSVILRLLAVFIFSRSREIGELFKKLAVYQLITRKKKVNGKVIRKIIFYPDKVDIKDNIKVEGILFYKSGIESKAIHMASSGYTLPEKFLQN